MMDENENCQNVKNKFFMMILFLSHNFFTPE